MERLLQLVGLTSRRSVHVELEHTSDRIVLVNLLGSLWARHLLRHGIAPPVWPLTKQAHGSTDLLARRARPRRRPCRNLLPLDEASGLQAIDDSRHVGRVAVKLAGGLVHRHLVTQLSEEQRLGKGEVELRNLGVVVAHQVSAQIHHEPDNLFLIGRPCHRISV